MPALVPLPIIDANGDGLIDGTGISLQEAETAVVVVGGVVLTILAAPEITAAMLIDLIITAIFDILATGGSTVGLTEQQSIQLESIYNLATSGGVGFNKLEQLITQTDTDVLAITPGGDGGLTSDEHSILVRLGAGSGAGSIGEQVWNYMLSGDLPGFHTPWASAGDYLDRAVVSLSLLMAYQGLPVPDRQWFKLVTPDSASVIPDLSFWLSPAANVYVPSISLATVQKGDTAYSFLMREYPSFNWHYGGIPGYSTGNLFSISAAAFGTIAYYVCTLTDADVASAWPTPDVNVNISLPMAPLLDPTKWERSYQDAISFSAPFVHLTPCDGVKFSISTGAPFVKGFAVGDRTIMTGAGVILFVDDEGEPEPMQYITADHGIVLPKSITHPGGFIWSSNIKLSGSVRPFTLVPVTE